MYQVIGTVGQMEKLSASFMDCIPSQVSERLRQRIETLEECYGADRDLEEDLGGYAVIFHSMTLKEQAEHRNILEKYHADVNEYEFQDVITVGEGQKWIEELYILSADFAIIVFYPVEAEMDGDICGN